MADQSILRHFFEARAEGIRYTLERGAKHSEEEIAMIEAARELPEVFDEDNSPIDPVSTPEQYAALMRAVAERNRRIGERQKELS